MGNREMHLTERVKELARQQRILAAQLLDTIAEMDQIDIAKRAGYTRLQAFLAEVLNITSGKASRLMNQAESITEVITPTGHVTPAPLPAVRDAAHAGLIDGEHIAVIADAVRQLPTWVSTADRELVEHTLVQTAHTATPFVVGKHAAVLLDRFDQDGREPNQEQRLAEPVNTFRSRRLRDGTMKFSGQLEAEIAEVLESLLGVLAKPMPGGDPRSREQRQGDALSDVIDRAATSPTLPTQGGEKPHLVVHLDYQVLTNAVGTATLDSGTALSPSAVRRLACDAHLIPMVLNGESVPLDLGRAKRVVSPDQRRALITRDRGCAYPDCPIPARWCDVHHIQHWLHGGRTDLANLVLLCRRHHRVLHHSPWTITINARDGLPEFTPPKWVDPDQHPRRNQLHRTRQ